MTTYTPEAIEAACIEQAGGEVQWNRYSDRLRAELREGMMAILAAADAAMEAAGFVRVPVEPWQDISTAPRIDGAQYLAELHWYPPGLDGRAEYREIQYDIIKWTDFNKGGWVRYANGRPVRWCPLPIPGTMIAARPTEEKE